jgi:hypothetical protein
MALPEIYRKLGQSREKSSFQDRKGLPESTQPFVRQQIMKRIQSSDSSNYTRKQATA